MHNQSTTTPIDRLAKRNRLKELVAELGLTATPAQVREHAYRVGLGAVNAAMLVCVRNELWPDRPKRGGGRPRGVSTTSLTIPADATFGCPACGSYQVRRRAYYVRVNGTVNRYCKCHKCNHRFVVEYAEKEAIPDYRRTAAAVATERVCTACKQNLPINQFGKRAGDTVFRRSHCKECSARLRAEHGFKMLLSRHGITGDEYWGMYERQGGKCAICGVAEMRGGPGGGKARLPFCLDHCHTTNKVRGLLCNRCNLGIGNFDDDPARLESAAAYVQRHTETS